MEKIYIIYHTKFFLYLNFYQLNLTESKKKD